MADLFKDIVPSILKTNQDVLEEERDYVPFIVNKALSYHYDCVLYANQMNMSHTIDSKMQYDFLKAAVRKRSRPFQPWAKLPVIADLDLVKEFYKLSNEKAKETLELLSQEQLQKIRHMSRKGGLGPSSKKDK